MTDGEFDAALNATGITLLICIVLGLIIWCATFHVKSDADHYVVACTNWCREQAKIPSAVGWGRDAQACECGGAEK